MASHEDVLRKLAVRDDTLVSSILERSDSAAPSGLDTRTWALVRLGALASVNATTPSYMGAADAAHAAGASFEEIVGTLIAVMPAVGVARVVAAAPRLALALGYDVDAAFEQPGELT